ncbi:hypothetical protein [Virgibacillus sp. CBA3643]|uniref:hypothetical protein n=1 Tax=Virgibacillus sp. CBA3643 TaxID=2942278 RepID=UPI0035A3806C
MIGKDVDFYKGFQELSEQEKSAVIMYIGSSLEGQENQLLDECLKMINKLQEKGGKMDNYAALGYMIKTAEDLGYQEQHIWELTARMLDTFDQMTEEEAKELYRNY